MSFLNKILGGSKEPFFERHRADLALEPDEIVYFDFAGIPAAPVDQNAGAVRQVGQVMKGTFTSGDSSSVANSFPRGTASRVWGLSDRRLIAVYGVRPGKEPREFWWMPREYVVSYEQASSRGGNVGLKLLFVDESTSSIMIPGKKNWPAVDEALTAWLQT